MKAQQLIKDIEKDYLIVGNWDREIVAKRVGILGGLGVALTLIVSILNQSGVHFPDGLPNKVTLIVTGILNVAALLGSVLWARTGTTVADVKLNPISSTGAALIEAPVAAAALKAAGVVSGPVLAELDADAAATLADPVAPATTADSAPAVAGPVVAEPTPTIGAPITFEPVEEPK